MTNEWLNKEPEQGVGWRKRTKAGRIRLLEERVARLEERLSPPLSVLPYNKTPTDLGQLPRISTGGPANTAGTFRDEINHDPVTYGYPKTTG